MDAHDVLSMKSRAPTSTRKACGGRGEPPLEMVGVAFIGLQNRKMAAGAVGAAVEAGASAVGAWDD